MLSKIDRLAKDVKSAMENTDDTEEIVAAVKSLAQPLADDQSWVTPESYCADEAQGIGIRVFHEDPENGLLIETVCWLPGRGVKPHDHQTWGVVIGLDGEETNVTWRRVDDGSKSDYAKIEVAKENVVRRGDAVCLLNDDIHSVVNRGKEPSLSLHIYGKNLARTDRSEFDPVTNTRRPCPKRERSRA